MIFEAGPLTNISFKLLTIDDYNHPAHIIVLVPSAPWTWMRKEFHAAQISL